MKYVKIIENHLRSRLAQGFYPCFTCRLHHGRQREVLQGLLGLALAADELAQSPPGLIKTNPHQVYTGFKSLDRGL